MRAQLLTCVLMSVVLFACTKPVALVESDDVVDVTTSPAAGSCGATKLKEVRYATTVPRQTQLRAEIGDRSCVVDVYEKLANDIACAQTHNRAAWEHAYASHGLTPFEPAAAEVWLDGYALEPGAIQAHPDDEDLRVVLLGYEDHDNCSGTSIHTLVNPGISLARNRAGELVVVLPKPTIEQRSYAACSCFPGCGAYMEPMPRFAVFAADEIVGEPVELVYPAIAISTHAVENETCCCAP